MFIRKKPPRSHALGEPLRHENHPRPVTRRELLARRFPVRLGHGGRPRLARRAAAKRAGANAGTLVADIQALLASGQCNVQSARRRHPLHLLRPRRRRQPRRLGSDRGRAGRPVELPLDRRLRQARRAGQHGAELERQHGQQSSGCCGTPTAPSSAVSPPRPLPPPPPASAARCSARCRRTTPSRTPTTPCTASPRRAPTGSC